VGLLVSTGTNPTKEDTLENTLKVNGFHVEGKDSDGNLVFSLDTEVGAELRIQVDSVLVNDFIVDLVEVLR
jgi:hypothetical protein